MSLNERISQLIEYSKLSASEFADAIEVQRSSISHITSGRNKPSLDFLIKVKDYLPELTWEWLIKGEGEMFSSEKSDAEKEAGSKTRPTSLPDLFSLIDDDQFGNTESEDRTHHTPSNKQDRRDFSIPAAAPVQGTLNDSQGLDTRDDDNKRYNSVSHMDRVKKIVMFFESGKFEMYEP